MNAIYNQILFISEIVLLTILVISLLQRGFFWAWLRARLSPKKVVVIKCYGGKDPYYRNGKIENNPLRVIFKDMHSKMDKSIMISNSKTQIHRDMGVQFVEVDTQKDCTFEHESVDKEGNKKIITINGFKAIDYQEMVKAVNGHDGEKYEGLCLRHLYRPSLMEDQLKKQLWILVIIMLLVAINLYFTYKDNKALVYLIKQSGACNDIKTILMNQTQNVIVI